MRIIVFRIVRAPEGTIWWSMVDIDS